MSKGSKHKFKQFEIRTVEDACLVLKALIVPVIIDLEKFINYSTEAENILAEYSPVDTIPANIYDSIHDKVLYQQRELLRFIADHQSSSFSYIEVRKIIAKRGFLKRKLSEENTQLLNELLDIRNWSFHNVQSMLVADLELAKKSIPKEIQGTAVIRPMLNPVVIRKIQSYDWEMLKGFVDHNRIRADQFNKILAEMKSDYQELISALPQEEYYITGMGFSRDIRYVEKEIVAQNSKSAGSDIAYLSMGIQKGKYDGTDDSAEKLINNDISRNITKEEK